MTDHIICHYSEIALKKGNRPFFERVLVNNIKRVLGSSRFLSVRRISGRIVIKLSNDGIADKEGIASDLGKVFGISDFLFCFMVAQDIEIIGKTAVRLFEKEDFKTFKVETKRSEKKFSLTSQEVSAKIGETVLNSINGLKVSMSNPERTCFIEIVGKDAFVSIDKVKGLGGLPVGTGGRAISLLSGGIDSPVAGFLMMRRGVKLAFIHFHSYPETSENSIEKVRNLARVLARYQGETKLCLVPFAEAQREIFLAVDPEDRVIFYRRLMFKISSEIAKKEKALALVTGENLGQVASQTLENIGAIERGSKLPILRPLICEDKESIITKAKKIGTYEISILPHDDCCVRFMPRHPETRAETSRIMKEEERLDIIKIISRAIEEMSCETINKDGLD